MEWMAIIGNSIQYIEEHITVDSVANSVGVSSFYFQKGFSMLCGFTVIANAKTFPYEGAREIIPQFWQEHLFDILSPKNPILL